ncbi:hypothetical protein FA15DRAFT_759078 [Coprinopsis marcescibilis]|uniref:Uncharacterized protein n=1 Tax=Coprinopsis marcescibilis TaxID=230819 RepID=A0A5C3KKW4_COPMA|nr:hypothetical protein FA15DRAFT_759078 [Coprinopsis marcescibilis]
MNMRIRLPRAPTLEKINPLVQRYPLTMSPPFSLSSTSGRALVAVIAVTVALIIGGVITALALRARSKRNKSNNFEMALDNAARIARRNARNNQPPPPSYQQYANDQIVKNELQFMTNIPPPPFPFPSPVVPDANVPCADQAGRPGSGPEASR